MSDNKTSSNDSFVDVAMEDLEGYTEDAGDATEASPPALELKVTPRHNVVGIDNFAVKTVQVCATVTASSHLINEEDRAPVDVTVALDVSGSMWGEKLELCKSTLELLIRELRPCDRFGLVTFADDARLEIPTRKLTRESKQAALSKVKRLSTRGCTNLSGGISLAIQEMKAVETPNQVRSIFVLTDGLPNVGVVEKDGIVDLAKGCLGTTASSPISISAFGYGRDHNAKILGAISQITQGGSYYFVETDSDVASAFGDCLGGILSVVAQNAVLTISVPPEAAMLGVKVVKIHHDTPSVDTNGNFKVSLGDFYSEESRDVVFEVTCATASRSESPIVHASCSIDFVDVIQKRIATGSPALASIARPPGSEISEPNAHVVTQWLRISAADAMKRADSLLQQGHPLSSARVVIQTCLDEIAKEDSVRSEPLVAQLVSDLKESLEGLADQHTYRSGGEMKMQTRIFSHSAQRCYESSAQADNFYCTLSKKKRSLKFSR